MSGTGWLISNRHLFLTVWEVGKSRIMALADWVFGEGIHFLDGASSLCPRVVRGVSLGLFYRTLILPMRALSSWPDHLLKALPPTVAWGTRFSRYGWGDGYSDQSTSQKLPWGQQWRARIWSSVAQESLRRLSKAVTISRWKWADLLKRVTVSAQDNSEGLDFQPSLPFFWAPGRKHSPPGRGSLLRQVC